MKRTFPSPLRYPGGKSAIAPIISQIIGQNFQKKPDYVEPYVGGAGLALSLLYNDNVEEIHINDLDQSIWCFWHSILEYPREFISKLKATNVTLDNWHAQREIQRQGNVEDPLELGFSTFFLNRCNRSGIIKKAGVIGGISQSGSYKIDCRFNKEDLIERILRVHRYKSRINLSNFDAICLMSRLNDMSKNLFFCIDPPYFNKGSQLYDSFYQSSDHEKVASSVLNLKCPWILTYDNTMEIRRLYKSRRHFTFDINYSLQTKRKGTEILVASKGLKVPHEIRAGQISPIYGEKIHKKSVIARPSSHQTH